MRICLNRPFRRFALKEAIEETSLCDAVLRAENALIDADLGGSVIKQRIARPGEGKSGGYRSIILYRRGDRAFFVYGYPKNQRDNITEDELKGFKKLAGVMLSYSDKHLTSAIQIGVLSEVICDEPDV